jgi:hypothetical protein
MLPLIVSLSKAIVSYCEVVFERVGEDILEGDREQGGEDTAKDAVTFVQTLKRFLKGSVQRKLRWVKNSSNHWVSAIDRDAGYNFFALVSLHLVFLR